MKQYMGVYGFGFRTIIDFDDFKLLPIYSDFKILHNLCSNTNKYFLTGLFEYDNSVQLERLNHIIFILSGILSFCEQRDVIIRDDVFLVESYWADFSNCFLEATSERRGGTPLLEYSEKKLCSFLPVLYKAVMLEGDPNNKFLKGMIFKSVEKNRLRKNFIEITYFLLFSGLEAFCKSFIKETLHSKLSNDCSQNIAMVLDSLKIPYILDRTNKKSSMNYYFNPGVTPNKKYDRMNLRVYVELRNTLFHEGVFETEITFPDEEVHTVRLTQMEPTLQELINVIVLKYTGLYSPTMNWAGWASGFTYIR